MTNPTNPATPWWKLGRSAWLVVLLLVLVNVAIFVGRIPFDRETFAWTVCRLHPEYWPKWISYAMWCVVAVLLLEVPRWSKADRWRLRRIELAFAVIVVVVFTVCLGDFFWANRLRYGAYNVFYLRYFMGPVARFFTDGYWDWKTFIMPGFGITALGTLLYLAAKLKRNKGKVEKSDGERENNIET